MLGSNVRAVRDVLGLVRPWQCVLVIGGLSLSNLFDLFGLTMIVPLLASVASFGQGKLGLLTALRAAVEEVGLPFHPATFLTLIVVGLTLKAVTAIAVMRYVGSLVATIGRTMQLRVIRSLMKARWDFFIRQPLGRLGSAAGPEAAAAGECFLSLTTLIAAGLQTLLFLAIAAIISVELAAVTLVVTVLMLASFGRLVQQGRQADRIHRRKVRGMGTRFIDAVAGIKPLRAMGRTDHFSMLFEADARALAAAMRARALSAEFARELQEPIIGTIIAVGFLYAATNTTLAGHELLIMGILLVRTIGSARPVQRSYQRFAQEHDRLHSLERFLAKVEAAADVSAGHAAPPFTRDITFEQVSFAYAGRPILDSLSLIIPRARITTLTGRSGVGKSTLVDILAGLHQPSGGRVLVDGHDLLTFDLAAWRRMIGYVPQDVSLFHTTVLDNVALGGGDAKEAEVVNALKAAGAWSFVELLQDSLHYIVGERGLGLSGGQRQRIAIARALFHRPRLLILDEATTGLDQATEHEICGTIKRLIREQDLTVLAISHQPAWQAIADRVYRIKDARTVELVRDGGGGRASVDDLQLARETLG
jgi:ATP-binding cassette subfamily C protein